MNRYNMCTVTSKLCRKCKYNTYQPTHVTCTQANYAGNNVNKILGNGHAELHSWAGSKISACNLESSAM